MYPIHLLWHVVGALVMTVFWIRFMRAWPLEAEKYPRRTRLLLFLSFSSSWEEGVETEHLPSLRDFRRTAATWVGAMIAFAYAEFGYCLAAAQVSNLLR